MLKWWPLRACPIVAAMKVRTAACAAVALLASLTGADAKNSVCMSYYKCSSTLSGTGYCPYNKIITLSKVRQPGRQPVSHEGCLPATANLPATARQPAGLASFSASQSAA